MPIERWLVYGLLSASSAAAIPVLARVGLKGVNSDLATVVRSLAMTAVLLVVGTVLDVWSKIPTLLRPGTTGPADGAANTAASGVTGAGVKAIAVLVLTGVAGATSWLFYYKALKLADVSKVGPVDKLSVPLAIILAVVLLGDRPTILNWCGIAMVVGGAYLAALPSK